MFGHILIYLYEDKRKVLPTIHQSDPEQILESELALHSVTLSGLDKDSSPIDLKNNLISLFQYTSLPQPLEDKEGIVDEDVSNGIIHIQILANYQEVLNIYKKLEL